MTKADAAEIVAILAAAFPHHKLTEESCQVYESMLADLDKAVAKRAAARLICTQKFMPSVAEIRAAAVELQVGPRRMGGEAWGDVGAAVRRFGRYQSPEFDDPLVAECVRQLGWVSVCSSNNEMSDRARFIELYDGLALRDRADDVAGEKLALPKPVSKLLGGMGKMKVIGNGGSDR